MAVINSCASTATVHGLNRAICKSSAQTLTTSGYQSVKYVLELVNNSSFSMAPGCV